MSTVSLEQVESIAHLCLHNLTENGFKTQVQSTQHRVDIVTKWDIPKGSKVLEIGCGQGDCTAVLADFVGPEGHVTAVDPGSLDYGSPYTLGQAQAHLTKEGAPLHGRISWKQADPLKFLEDDDTKYDIAVLVLCTWYFSSSEVLANTLSALSKRVSRICIAEWSLSSATADTHILAALTQAALERHNPNSSSNVRTLFSPAAIKSAAKETGWSAESEATFTPRDHVLDGQWEVGAVTYKSKDGTAGFSVDVEKYVKDEKDKSVIYALRDATLASLERVGGPKSVKSMDVWCASLKRSN
ncbi:S-adenosyl-L-methionine-dependent methyltransferase [Athelia psychrophila]|uniref:S-adenosyl-L-methionine-dependent methyltransferase n=1 Tax=Athelia psychrophila TaxID=1759441 RepID=A0A165YV45_9AGAM|nr:S-adenosyl-L-methionine-dependent methyltransferase [Fibularhizoctonia sp. CBS 109695]